MLFYLYLANDAVEINFSHMDYRKNGTSFIEFNSHKVANLYINEYNNKNINGNLLNISMAKHNLSSIENSIEEKQNGNYSVSNIYLYKINFYLFRFLLEI